MDAMNVVPFGKYKGQPVETLRADAGYCEWLMAQDWFRQRYQGIYTLVINNFGEPSETPEHNRLQARFLEKDFCAKLLIAYKWEPFVSYKKYINRRMYGSGGIIPKLQDRLRTCISNSNANIESIANYQEYIKDSKDGKGSKYLTPTYYERLLKDLEKSTVELADKMSVAKDELVKMEEYAKHPDAMAINIDNAKFEVGGWDVVFDARANDDTAKVEGEIRISIELKPSLGDEFPAVLRQMKANAAPRHRGKHTFNINCGKMVLVFDQFSAKGATLDQVKAMFETSNISVLSINEIEQMDLPDGYWLSASSAVPAE